VKGRLAQDKPNTGDRNRPPHGESHPPDDLLFQRFIAHSDFVIPAAPAWGGGDCPYRKSR
jgi:hypothetical protein